MNEIPFPPPVAPGAALAQLGLSERSDRIGRGLTRASELSQSLSALGAGYAERIGKTVRAAGRQSAAVMRDIWSQKRGGEALARDWVEYATDFAQRSALFLDIMREVGNTFNEQLADPARPPVLIYEYEVVV
ncbi:MAG: alpha/beta hydrolase, partial [Roseiarcus sp.]